MEEQTFGKIRRTLAILLAVCFLVSVTVAAASAIPVLRSITSSFEAKPDHGPAPLTVKFTDHSSSDKKIKSWDWNFNDGTKHSSQKNPTHTFKTPGYYNVVLTTKNNVGSTATYSKGITVEGMKCDFKANKKSGYAPLTVTFTDLSGSENSISDWSWNFGDKSPIDYSQNPAHTYKKAGKYTVSLTVTDWAGNKATEVKPKYVRVK